MKIPGISADHEDQTIKKLAMSDKEDNNNENIDTPSDDGATETATKDSKRKKDKKKKSKKKEKKKKHKAKKKERGLKNDPEAEGPSELASETEEKIGEVAQTSSGTSEKVEAPSAGKNGNDENSDGGDNDEDDDDDELLAAAALWAGDEENEESQASTLTKPSNPFAASSRTVHSLHITQLPYDSTDFDLRKLFAEQGCSTTSIRLVYDRDTEGRKTVFRGVAFADFSDNASYQKALSLHHKTSIRGRRLNIRPCKSKEELAEIVARTQTLVHEKIRQQRSGGDASAVAGAAAETPTSSQPSSKSPKTNSKKRKNDPKDRKNKNKKPRVDKDGKPIKLTKKERNRRAAIIMQKRRRQKK